jgi:acylphosphatase
MIEPQRLEATVRGYVQGVGYRAFALRQARALRLTGWVRNAADGAVQVVAEGERRDLVSFLAALRDGPSESEVQDVDFLWQPFTGSFALFEVKL